MTSYMKALQDDSSLWKPSSFYFPTPEEDDYCDNII